VTLDGVYQGPGSADEDTTDGFTRGGWMVPHMDQAFIDIAAGWLAHADALLLGRRTYEAFARDWPQITDPDDPFTTSMNGLPKYVASNTLTVAGWAPTTILSGDVVQAVAKLKAARGRELQRFL
jgi:dihydrofolate reductase